MEIIKRKKGNNEYYYLKHSFRRGKKVITKEKYLGKSVPKDIEKLKQELLVEEKKELYKKLEKIKTSFQKEWKSYPKTIKEKVKEQIAITFTYNTNAIEGSIITLEEVEEIVHDKISPNKPLRDVKEAEYHAKVFLEMLEKKEKVSDELMLKWHQEIFDESKNDISGKYRDYLVRVGPYLAPDWQDVDKMINDLFKFVNNSKINPVELAGIAHYRFEKIHPFGDGNGRIGRLLMNYILWHAGYPMLIIEYKKRASYYKALQRDEEGFLKYFLRRYLAMNKGRF